jgi:hypothetical protein
MARSEAMPAALALRKRSLALRRKEARNERWPRQERVRSLDWSLMLVFRDLEWVLREQHSHKLLVVTGEPDGARTLDLQLKGQIERLFLRLTESA